MTPPAASWRDAVAPGRAPAHRLTSQATEAGHAERPSASPESVEQPPPLLPGPLWASNRANPKKFARRARRGRGHSCHRLVGQVE
eukprot:3780359-Pyramimonas_sp.AAC.1